MAVYPERRSGRLTGVWIAEVTHLGKRRRDRFQTKHEAERWDGIVKLTGALPAEDAKAEPTVKTFAQVANELKAAGGPDGTWAHGKDPSVIQRLEYVCATKIGSTAIDKVSYGMVEALVVDDLKKRPGQEPGSKMAPSTINRYITAISSVLSYAERKEYRNGTPQLPWQKVPKKKKQTYKDAQAAATLAYMRSKGWDTEAFCFEVLDRTAFRRGELLGLKATQIEDDIDASTGQRVGCVINLDNPEDIKNEEVRTVWIPAEMGDRLRELIKKKQMPKAFSLYRKVRAANEAAGHSIKRPLHTIRRTACTRTVAAEQDLQVAKELLGHKNIQTTIGYRDVDREVLRERAKKIPQRAGQVVEITPQARNDNVQKAPENKGEVEATPGIEPGYTVLQTDL